MKGNFFYRDNNRYQIIIKCGADKFGMKLNDRHNDAQRFHIFISEAQLAQAFCTANFVELRIVTMIHHTHLIGKRVMNSYLSFGSKQGF